MNRWEKGGNLKNVILSFIVFLVVACAQEPPPTIYHDPDMDFAAVKSVAVMPFKNLTNDKAAAERIRDTFVNNLLSTSSIYVIPVGEVARGISRVGAVDPAAPSSEEIFKLAVIVKADAVITGVVREYGTVRSGSTSANVISVSAQMIDVQTGTTVWTASTTKGGVTAWDRLFGGGGQPMSDVTEAAVDDIITKLFSK